MIELLQFRHSPYNEKVRWALDLKRLPHRRRSLLPGPHMGVVKKLTGRTQTPVLRLDDGSVIAGSSLILDWLEQQHPEPRLMPDDAAQHEQVLAIQRRFDEDITPRIRRAVLDALLRRPRYFAAVFGEAETPLKQRLYSLIVPLAAPLVRKGNGISGAAAIADGIAAGFEGAGPCRGGGSGLPRRRPLRPRRHHCCRNLGDTGAPGQFTDAKPATGGRRVRETDRAFPRPPRRRLGTPHLRRSPWRQRRL
jgi:glutathione S-transferase